MANRCFGPIALVAVTCLVTSAFATVVAAETKAQQAKSSALHRAFAALHRVIDPILEKQSAEEKLPTICTTCTPAPVSDWRPEKFYSLAADRTTKAQAFLRHLRRVVAAGACDGHRDALAESNWLSANAEDAMFTEAEALYLDNKSKSVGLDFNFRKAVRAKAMQDKDTVQNLPAVSQVAAVLRSGNAPAALNVLPDFKDLCQLR